MELLNKKKFKIDEQLIQKGEREGIPIEKGIALTQHYLEKNEELFKKYANFFTAYPDLFLDLISPEDSNFELFFYQRIFLRACMRFRIIYVTACRAWSKSFLTILALVLQCIFIPGHKNFICAPNKNQGAQIAKEKLTEIFQRWPLIRKEVVGGDISETPGNYGKDYVTLTFKNGSKFDVKNPTASFLAKATM